MKQKWNPLYFGMVVLCVTTGCQHRYHLKGHSRLNASSPPDVTIDQGKVVKGVSEPCCSPLVPVSAMSVLSTLDTNIVEVFTRSGKTAYVKGLRTGTARMMYWDRGEGEVDFLIHVN